MTGRLYDQAEYKAAKLRVRYLACHWCGRPGTIDCPCEPDHDPPIAQGGTNASIVPACMPCNRRRGGLLSGWFSWRPKKRARAEVRNVNGSRWPQMLDPAKGTAPTNHSVPVRCLIRFRRLTLGGAVT